MLGAKLQLYYLQPECLHSYNAVLVVLPSVCLLLIAVTHMCYHCQMPEWYNESTPHLLMYFALLAFSSPSVIWLDGRMFKMC